MKKVYNKTPVLYIIGILHNQATENVLLDI